MAHDLDRNRTVLFGGVNASGSLLQDTWEWDGQAWHQMQPPAAPPACTGASMAFDRARGRTVLCGGQGTAGYLSDVWDWDGRAWTLRFLVPRPAGRADAAMAYCTRRERVLYFGGRAGTVESNDTWLLGAAHPASATAFGRGCHGFFGTPQLAASEGSRPWIDGVFTAQASFLPPALAVVLMLGMSRDSMGGILPLPLDLTGIGMNGCLLYTSSDVLFGISQQGAGALWSVPLCNCPELRGGAFFAQVLALDPLSNPFGALLSNGLAAQIGAR